MGVTRLILRNASAWFFYQVLLKFLLEENFESGENLVQNDIKNNSNIVKNIVLRPVLDVTTICSGKGSRRPTKLYHQRIYITTIINS